MWTKQYLQILRGIITNPLLTFKFILLVFADGKLFDTYIYGYVVL